MQEFAYNKKVMGTEVSVSVITKDKQLAEQVTKKAFELIADYEQIFSRFIPASELSSLNASGSSVVSNEFFAVLERSYELHRETQGAFNPLVQITRHGYDADYSELTDTIRKQNTNTYNIDFEAVTIDKKTKRVTLCSSQQLDFNGILKGYLATKLVSELKEKYPNCSGLIINLGGDLHTFGLDEDRKAFEFYLYNPVTEKEKPVKVTDKSLVTSGTYKRTWKTKDGEKHHILGMDGKGNPDSNIVSASVIHTDGATAEAYATLFVVKGLEEAEKIINSRDFTYWLVQTDGEVLTNII
jgi:thiamine biosynthesis lipoprotein